MDSVENLLQNYQRHKESNKRALCWAFYEIVEERSRYFAQCLQYQQEGREAKRYKYAQGGGTTNLRDHVEKRHKMLLQEVRQITSASSSLSEPTMEILSDLISNEAPIASRLRSKTGGENLMQSQELSETQKQKDFNIKLGVLICKNHIPLRTVDSDWFKTLIAAANPKIKVPSRRRLVDKILPDISNKTMQKYVLPSLEQSESGTLAFDL